MSKTPDPSTPPPKHPGPISDKLCRKYLSRPQFAGEVIEYYTDEVLLEHIDTAALQPAPTSGIAKELKERISDVAFVTELLDPTNNTKLLLTFEAKSRPTVFAPLQLLTCSTLSSFLEFADAGYPETFSGKYHPKISIMFLVYYGTEDIDDNLDCQSIHPNLPEWAKELVPQCRIIVINMRKYRGGKFPGPPIVRAWAESLTWVPEGKVSKNLGSIFGNFHHGPITEVTLEMIRDILEVCFKRESITEDEVDSALSGVFTTAEDKVMLQTMKQGFYQEAEARGDARGAAREGRQRLISVILKSICKHCHVAQVPADIEEELNNRQDIFVLESLFEDSLECTSLDEFRQKL